MMNLSGLLIFVALSHAYPGNAPPTIHGSALGRPQIADPNLQNGIEQLVKNMISSILELLGAGGNGAVLTQPPEVHYYGPSRANPPAPNEEPSQGYQTAPTAAPVNYEEESPTVDNRQADNDEDEIGSSPSYMDCNGSNEATETQTDDDNESDNRKLLYINKEHSYNYLPYMNQPYSGAGGMNPQMGGISYPNYGVNPGYGGMNQPNFDGMNPAGMNPSGMDGMHHPGMGGMYNPGMDQPTENSIVEILNALNKPTQPTQVEHHYMTEPPKTTPQPPPIYIQMPQPTQGQPTHQPMKPSDLEQFQRIPENPYWDEYYKTHYIPRDQINYGNGRVSKAVMDDFKQFLVDKLNQENNFAINFEHNNPPISTTVPPYVPPKPAYKPPTSQGYTNVPYSQNNYQAHQFNPYNDKTNQQYNNAPVGPSSFQEHLQPVVNTQKNRPKVHQPPKKPAYYQDDSNIQEPQSEPPQQYHQHPEFNNDHKDKHHRPRPNSHHSNNKSREVNNFNGKKPRNPPKPTPHETQYQGNNQPNGENSSMGQSNDQQPNTGNQDDPPKQMTNEPQHEERKIHGEGDHC